MLSNVSRCSRCSNNVLRFTFYQTIPMNIVISFHFFFIKISNNSNELCTIYCEYQGSWFRMLSWTNKKHECYGGKSRGSMFQPWYLGASRCSLQRKREMHSAHYWTALSSLWRCFFVLCPVFSILLSHHRLNFQCKAKIVNWKLGCCWNCFPLFSFSR